MGVGKGSTDLEKVGLDDAVEDANELLGLVDEMLRGLRGRHLQPRRARACAPRARTLATKTCAHLRPRHGERYV